MNPIVFCQFATCDDKFWMLAAIVIGGGLGLLILAVAWEWVTELWRKWRGEYRS